MKAIKFRLTGKTAFFKKPDVNSVLYFTYGNIHKVAILGLLGAVNGLKGYAQQDKKDSYPEFYEKMKNIKIAIEPLSENGYISKKVQRFNNSVGYASREEGGNLIVIEQWLENPSWNIYILEDENIYTEIRDRLCQNKFVYMPYLGKNDHFANIDEIDEIELDSVNDLTHIDTLFVDNGLKIESKSSNALFGNIEEYVEEFKYGERLPIALEESQNQYITEKFIFTNMRVLVGNNENIYSYGDKNIYFF